MYAGAAIMVCIAVVSVKNGRFVPNTVVVAWLLAVTVLLGVVRCILLE